MRRLLPLVVAAASLWAAPGAFAAGWCGTGASPIDRPDATTGRQIHAIWAVPADGGDTFAAGAAKIADDVASVTTWWQGQDSTRVPRFDEAAFAAGTCLDISSVRLAHTGADYASSASASTAFRLMQTDLVNAGFASEYKKYYVYFDGPPVQQNVCGTGGGDFASGPSYAVVWLQGCPGIATDNVGAHELLHALGALPDGAPHACTAATDPFGVDDPGHPCDSKQDILYPANQGLSLSQEILDVGHDDYYGHNGTWDDLQDSLWLHLLNVPSQPLTVAIAGAGEIDSDVPGVACTATCTTQWDSGSQVTLTAVPTGQTRFVAWRGACTGAGDCPLVLDGARVLSAIFGPARIPVTVRTTGKGTVACSPRCSQSFVAGTRLTLRAVAATGWRFAGWSGSCRGASLVCRPRTDFAVSARATFRKR